MFFLCFSREVFSLKKLFSLGKKLCQRDTKDFMASTVFIHLDHTLPSLEKARLLPHCITFGSSQGFFCLKEARQPAQGCRLDHCSQRLFSSWARGSSLKHPGSTAKRRAQLHLRNLEEMKAVFCRCGALCLKSLRLGHKSFLGDKSNYFSFKPRAHCFLPPLPPSTIPQAPSHSA